MAKLALCLCGSVGTEFDRGLFAETMMVDMSAFRGFSRLVDMLAQRSSHERGWFTIPEDGQDEQIDGFTCPDFKDF